MKSAILRAIVLIGSLSAIAADDQPAKAPDADRGRINDLAVIEAKKDMKPGQSPLQFPKGDGLRVIVIGNSWTVPVKKPLPEIALAAGIKDQHLLLRWNGSFAGHADAFFKNKQSTAEVFPALASGQWDVLSLLARAGCNDKPEHFLQWMELGLKSNSNLVFRIQEGWPRPLPLSNEPWNPESGKKVKAAMADPAAVLARMEAQLAKENAEFKALVDAIEARYPGRLRVIPCGSAVVEMVRLHGEGKLPGFDCIMEYDYNGNPDKANSGLNPHGLGARGIFSDNGHLSESGKLAQLLGYLFYASLYGKSPVLIPNYAPADIDPRVDQLMRQTAWKALTSDPLSGITDRNGNGLADADERAEVNQP